MFTNYKYLSQNLQVQNDHLVAVIWKQKQHYITPILALKLWQKDNC